MSMVVEITLGFVWMGHTSWITANDVEVSSRGHTSLGVPLYLEQTREKLLLRSCEIGLHIYVD